jgi:thiol-disulfide isomerase/thioredoxin
MKTLVKFVAVMSLVSVAGVVVMGGPVVARVPQTLTAVPDRPQAPAFDLKDPDGRSVRLADFRGKPLIVNFWATWCPPCREEMPSMQRAADLVSNEGIRLVAINVGEDADTVSQYLMEARLDLPVLLDETSGVVMSYPVRGLPTTFVVDADGRLAYVATGGRAWDDPALLDKVRALKQ